MVLFLLLSLSNFHSNDYVYLVWFCQYGGAAPKNFCCLSGWSDIFPNWNSTILRQDLVVTIEYKEFEAISPQESSGTGQGFHGLGHFLLLRLVFPFSAPHHTCPLPLTLSDPFWMFLVLLVMKYSSWGQDLNLIIFEPFMSLTTLFIPSHWLINFNLG